MDPKDFNCGQCGVHVSGRWPVRGGGSTLSFCSFPCAWAHSAGHGDMHSYIVLMIWSQMRGCDIARLAYMGRG